MKNERNDVNNNLINIEKKWKMKEKYVDNNLI